jgi:outer membrane lipoprotein-sorting protein
MRNIPLILLIAIFGTVFLSSCSSSKTDASAKAVEDYLNTLVTKDADRLATLVCGDWEQDALMELDSLQAVTSRLDNVACTQTATDGDTALVTCTGKFITTYGNEDQELDLTTRTYQVVQQGGDWLVCGIR